MRRVRFKLNIRGQPIHRDAQQSELLTSSSSSGRARAAILVVARNEDCNGVLLSMQRMERRFNHKFQYPYVFLNNAPFSDLFRKRCHLHAAPFPKRWNSASALLQYHSQQR